MNTSVPPRARALVVCIVILGLATTVTGVAANLDVHQGTLALLVLAAILTELFQVEGDEGTGEPADSQQFSFSSGVHLAGVLMLGPWASAVIAATGVLVVDGLRRHAFVKVAYNASVFALAALAGGGVYVLSGGTPGTLEFPGAFLPIAAAWATYTLVNQLLVSLVVAFLASVPVRPLLREKLEKDIPSAAAEAGLGIALAAFALAQPWAIVALAPLLLAVYQALERHAAQRRETARALEAFANVVDERDPHTFRHSKRVSDHVLGLAEALELPAADVARLRWAARLHDLGKIAVDPAILGKPAALTADERAVMERHPRLSARLLRRFRVAAPTARAVEFHHERHDGTGYYGVREDAMPLASHFIVIADSFDAMTSDRPYRSALDESFALAEIERLAGSQFHPGLARAFVALRRGEDPRAALTVAERSALSDIWGRGRDRPALARRVERHLWEVLVLGGAVAALAAVGIGQPRLALIALAPAAIGLAWLSYEARQLRRLSRSLTATLQSPLPSSLAFHAAVGRIESDADVVWAGFVGWSDRELVGTIELERRLQGTGPDERVLTSWLLREADLSGELLTVDGSELGVQGTYLAAPLLEQDAVLGFLVLGFGRGVPRHVELAVRARLDELARALLPATASAELIALPLAAAR